MKVDLELQVDEVKVEGAGGFDRRLNTDISGCDMSEVLDQVSKSEVFDLIASDLSVSDVISEFDQKELLEYMDDTIIVEYLQSEGYRVEFD